MGVRVGGGGDTTGGETTSRAVGVGDRVGIRNKGKSPASFGCRPQYGWWVGGGNIVAVREGRNCAIVGVGDGGVSRITNTVTVTVAVGISEVAGEVFRRARAMATSNTITVITPAILAKEKAGV